MFGPGASTSFPGHANDVAGDQDPLSKSSVTVQGNTTMRYFRCTAQEEHILAIVIVKQLRFWSESKAFYI